jgi:lipopolysaccharide export system protein LptA
MINRKKKLKIVQFVLLIIGILVVFFTYYSGNTSKERILSKKEQEKINTQLNDKTQNSNTFFNIEYSGLDLAGNRYILKSKEATNDNINQEIINMASVEAKFYFKDDTVLEISSDSGLYNSVTLDMTFSKNVIAIYEDGKLSAEKAEYSNSKGFLTISNNVKVSDVRGTMFADKLLFDIKKQTLNIASNNDSKVNASINLK